MKDFTVGEVVKLDVYSVIKEVKHNFNGTTRLILKDVMTGNEFVVDDRYLLDGLYSASEYFETVKTSMTTLAEILKGAGTTPFTVTFIKSDGDLRTLTGCLAKQDALLGRSLVRDLYAISENDEGFRLVDHRTIESIIINNVKYVRKA